MKVSQQVSDARIASVTHYYSRECVLHTLQLRNIGAGRSIEKRVGVIQSRTHQRAADDFGHIVGQDRTDVTQSSYVETCRLADGTGVIVERQLVVECSVQVQFKFLNFFQF